MKSDSSREQRLRILRLAEANARRSIRPGDRLRVTKCPGTKRWITFSHWSGNAIVSKSGIDDYCAAHVDRLNELVVDFKVGPAVALMDEVGSGG